jgi:hypothetical protein
VVGPDVFGTTKVTAVVANPSDNGLVVKCDSSGSVSLAYVFPAPPDIINQVSNGTDVTGDLLLRVGTGKLEKLSGKLDSRNEKYLGFVSDGPVADLVTAVQAIGAASGHLDIGLSINDHHLSDSFGTVGSTDAMNKVLSDCKLMSTDNNATKPRSGQ